jgi:hypothetical protein
MTNLLSFDNAIGKLFNSLDKNSMYYKMLSRLNSSKFKFITFADDIPNIVGYSSNYNGNIIFCNGLPSIDHEMAHFVEIDKGRYLQDGFGLGIIKEFTSSTSTRLMKAALEREERVTCIQNFINKDKLSYKYKIQNDIWTNVIANVLVPTEFKSKKELINYAKSYHDKYKKTLNEDYILSEFNRRIDDVLNNLRNSVSKAALFIIVVVFKLKFIA